MNTLIFLPILLTLSYGTSVSSESPDVSRNEAAMKIQAHFRSRAETKLQPSLQQPWMVNPEKFPSRETMPRVAFIGNQWNSFSATFWEDKSEEAWEDFHQDNEGFYNFISNSFSFPPAEKIGEGASVMQRINSFTKAPQPGKFNLKDYITMYDNGSGCKCKDCMKRYGEKGWLVTSNEDFPGSFEYLDITDPASFPAEPNFDVVFLKRMNIETLIQPGCIRNVLSLLKPGGWCVIVTQGRESLLKKIEAIKSPLKTLDTWTEEDDTGKEIPFAAKLFVMRK